MQCVTLEYGGEDRGKKKLRIRSERFVHTAGEVSTRSRYENYYYYYYYSAHQHVLVLPFAGRHTH